MQKLIKYLRFACSLKTICQTPRLMLKGGQVCEPEASQPTYVRVLSCSLYSWPATATATSTVTAATATEMETETSKTACPGVESVLYNLQHASRQYKEAKKNYKE